MGRKGSVIFYKDQGPGSRVQGPGCSPEELRLTFPGDQGLVPDLPGVHAVRPQHSVTLGLALFGPPFPRLKNGVGGRGFLRVK